MVILQLIGALTAITAARGQYTAISSIGLTNLSPELIYTPHPIPGNTDPSAGWVTDEYGTWTNTTGNASVSIQWWGGDVLLRGNLSRVVTRVDADYVQHDNAEDYTAQDWWDTWPQIQYRPGIDGDFPPWWSEQEVMGQTGWAFRTLMPDSTHIGREEGEDIKVPYQRWNVSFELDQKSTYNRLINVSRVTMGIGLPAALTDDGYTRTIVRAAGDADDSDSTVPALPAGWSVPDSSADAWSSSPAPFNTTLDVGARWNNSLWDYEAIQATSARVLSTNTTDAPLRMQAPAEASLFMLFGAVGPEQGEFSVRLNVVGERQTQEFQPHNNTKQATANRQEESMTELLSLMWLDPRLQYEVEVTSLEEGRNMAIQAVVWTVSPQGGKTGDWWSEWNERALDTGGGLSGGQIAGIVEGKRSSSTGEKDGQLSPSQTLAGDAATTTKPPAAV